MKKIETIKSNLTITKLVSATVIISTVSVALLIGGLALEEIYRQKSRDVWSMIYLDLEKASERLALQLRYINRKSKDNDKTSFAIKSKAVTIEGSEKTVDILSYQKGLKLGVNNFIDLSLKKELIESNKEDEIITVGLHKGKGIFVEKDGNNIETTSCDLFSLVNVPENISTSSNIFLVNRSSYLLYSNTEIGPNWIKRRLIQDYIKSPLWQGQFEFKDENLGGALMHGFFQEIRGTNLVLFIEVPVSTVLSTILDPTKKFLAYAGVLSGVFTLFLLLICCASSTACRRIANSHS